MSAMRNDESSFHEIEVNPNWESVNSAHPRRPIHIMATPSSKTGGIGKTSVALGITSGLQRRFGRDAVGYAKPFTRSEHDWDLKLMNGRGNAIRGVVPEPILMTDNGPQKRTHDMTTSKHQPTKSSSPSSPPFLVFEGTDHPAAGTFCGTSDANVAKTLGADVILVASGGLGSTFDELALGYFFCKRHEVDVAGVILNSVKPEKFNQTLDYMSRALHQTWNIPLLGCIPEMPLLRSPSLADLQRALNATPINTHLDSKRQHCHYENVERDGCCLVTTSLGSFMQNLRCFKPNRTVYVCDVSRDDIILGFLGEYRRRRFQSHANNNDSNKFEAALIVCGIQKDDPTSPHALHLVQQFLSHDEEMDCPLLFTEASSMSAMDIIQNCVPKFHCDDCDLIETASNHFERHINIDLLLSQMNDDTQCLEERHV